MNTPHSSRHAGIVGAVAAAVILTAAGCSTSDTDNTTAVASSMGVTSTSAPATGAASSANEAHNNADIMFNQMMIPHHEQAVEMAGLVDTRTQNPQVRQLAAQIAAAQQPEIDQMTTRLTSWGLPVAMGEGHSGHGMSMGADAGHGMSGMMSDEQMSAMRSASGEQFDKLWLQGMISHHEGAIEMANTELAQGINPPSRQLAEQIKASQQAEIEQMQTMLGQ